VTTSKGLIKIFSSLVKSFQADLWTGARRLNEAICGECWNQLHFRMVKQFSLRIVRPAGLRWWLRRQPTTVMVVIAILEVPIPPRKNIYRLESV